MLQTRPSALEIGSGPIVPRLTYPIASLMAQIGEACDGSDRLMGERIAEALRAAAANPTVLSPERRAPCPTCYARHVIASDPAGRFTLLAIVWGPGQFSPPHAHQTWCAYAVVENALTETLFDYDPTSDRALPAGVSLRQPGYACFARAGLEQIHRLGNAGGVPAISLHAYGVEGSRIGTHVNRLVDVAP